ncbi:MAG: methyl-accepting chemotaxis protein [Candidatus Omnitrophica bacterium]|nr:methyl-accepting chemotaxis protein [Candidatus Omnitrophota bacterium]
MRQFFLVRNKLERRYLILIALSLMLPTLITGCCLYYVIFNLMAEQLGIPEIIAYHLLPVLRKVNMALAISLPVVFVILFWIGLVLTRNLVGPIERLESELRQIVSRNQIKKLKLRKRDTLKPLIEDINILLDKISHNK